MAGTCSPSYLGGRGRTIVWAWEVEPSVSHDHTTVCSLNGRARPVVVDGGGEGKSGVDTILAENFPKPIKTWSHICRKFYKLQAGYVQENPHESSHHYISKTQRQNIKSRQAPSPSHTHTPLKETFCLTDGLSTKILKASANYSHWYQLWCTKRKYLFTKFWTQEPCILIENGAFFTSMLLGWCKSNCSFCHWK